MTMSTLRQNLEERHSSLSDLRKRSVGEPEGAPLVCRVCFVAEPTCHCGRDAYTLIDVVLMELELLIDSTRPRATAPTVGR